MNRRDLDRSKGVRKTSGDRGARSLKPESKPPQAPKGLGFEGLGVRGLRV